MIIKPSLDDVLAYRNDELVAMFSKKLSVPYRDAGELFVDLKKWMWLIGIREEGGNLFPSFPEQWIIDSFWHEFILYTHAYMDFCNTYFGRYIHHAPTPEGLGGANIALAMSDMARFVEINKCTMKMAMTEVLEKLGIDVVIRWYRDIPARYPIKLSSQKNQLMMREEYA